MPRPEKVQQVELITEKLKKAKVAVLTDYRGLTVSQMEELREKLRGADVEYRVVKNTLAGLAAAESGHASFQEALRGPVAIACGYGCLGGPARVIADSGRQPAVADQRGAAEVAARLRQTGSRETVPDGLGDGAQLPPAALPVAEGPGQLCQGQPDDQRVGDGAQIGPAQLPDCQ